MKSNFLKPIFMVLILMIGNKIFSENRLFSWDFSDCDLRDILFAISADTGISITADDTINGKGNFRFVGSDFETAFKSFLCSERLFEHKQGDIRVVSRFQICKNNDLISFDCFDLTAELVIEKISVELNSVISFDSLPTGLFSIHLKNLSEKEILVNIVNRFSGYELIETENGFSISKKQSLTNSSGFQSSYAQIKKDKNGLYSIDARDCKSSDVLNKIFELENNRGQIKNFCILSGSDIRVQRCYLTEKNFEDILNTFCIQNGLSCEIFEEIYYIFPGKSIREQISDIQKKWVKINLEFIKSSKFIEILSKRLDSFDFIYLPDEYSFLCLVDINQINIIDEIKKEIDIKIESFIVDLKFLKPDELLKILPPSVDKSNLYFGEDKSCLYYKGNPKSYENFKIELEKIDQPAKRISYDLLILQFDEGLDESLAGNIKLKRITSGDRNNFAVQLGSVLNLNLNVVSAFGLNFAGSLENSIEKNKTKIFADTTLCGISGKSISFQNTNTYRYRDNNLDPDTGKPVYSGITKEIISGLKLDVTGWISGDGLITSTVTASITRRGNDSSSSTGNPPPTSEKLITTEVCGRNGEPVVLSGLIENTTSVANRHIPLLSKIPLIGWLFKSEETINQQSQMVIYLVPHIDESDFIQKRDSISEKEFVMEICNSLIQEDYNFD